MKYTKYIVEGLLVFLGILLSFYIEDKRIIEENTNYKNELVKDLQKIIESERDQIIDHISKKQIAVNVHYLPLPMLSFYKNMGYSMEDYPTSFKNYTCEISLPVYYNLSNEQVKEVANAVEDAVESIL